MQKEAFERACFLQDKIHNLGDLCNLIINARVKNVNSSLCAIRRANGNEYEIVNEVKISEDIQDKLFNVVTNEIVILQKEFDEL